MPKFRKKPVVIDAVLWTGKNDAEVDAFLGPSSQRRLGHETEIKIETLEGGMIARAGDWIIRGVKGELYPCKPDIFAATYEPAE